MCGDPHPYGSSIRCSSNLLGKRFLYQLVTAGRTKQVSLTSSSRRCNHVNMSVERLDLCIEFWPTYLLYTRYRFYCWQLKFRCNNTSHVRRTNIIYISRTTVLRLARQNKLHQCVPYFDSVTWRCLKYVVVSTDSAYNYCCAVCSTQILKGLKVESHFSWNQVVRD